MSSEAIALGVAEANKALEPGSEAFRLRNPGMLLDGRRYRRFGRYIDGLRALMADVEKRNKDARIVVEVTRYVGSDIEKTFTVLDYVARATGKEVSVDTTLGEV